VESGRGWRFSSCRFHCLISLASFAVRMRRLFCISFCWIIQSDLTLTFFCPDSRFPATKSEVWHELPGNKVSVTRQTPVKGGYTIVTLPRIVTPYLDSVDGTRVHVGNVTGMFGALSVFGHLVKWMIQSRPKRVWTCNVTRHHFPLLSPSLHS
jgi:hypothetical protein